MGYNSYDWRFTGGLEETLKGKIAASVEQIDDDEIIFTMADGSVYALYHVQDCCESVYIESIVGDLQDLVGVPLLLVEEAHKGNEEERDGEGLWTFYKFGTIKGYVDIRWYGSSNGYYGVGVDFVRIQEAQ